MDVSGISIPDFGSPTLQGLDLANAQAGQRIGGGQGGAFRQFVRFYKKKLAEVICTKARVNEKTGTSVPLETKVVEVEREFVEIVTPGDKNTVDAPAQDFHKREHARQYLAFREGRVAPVGTPIEQCTYVPPGVIMELAVHKVQVEEQLAGASDLLCGLIPNGYELREFARASVAAKANNETRADVLAVKSQLDQAHKQMAAMQEQLSKLTGGQILNASGEVHVSEESSGIQASPKRPVKTREMV